MIIAIAPSNPRDISWLGANMRPADVLEILCQLPPGTMGSEAALACHFSSPDDLRFMVTIDGFPVAAWGAVQMTHPVWQGWGFGTVRMARAVPAIQSHIIDVMTPILVARGCRRFEVRTLKRRGNGHLLIASIGARYCCDLPDSGHLGETLELWAWTREAPPHVFFRSQDAPHPATRDASDAS